MGGELQECWLVFGAWAFVPATDCACSASALQRPPLPARLPVPACQVVGVTLSQFVFAYMSMSWSWPWVLLAGWLLSGALNQNLFTAQHEISHFLAFRTPMLVGAGQQMAAPPARWAPKL